MLTEDYVVERTLRSAIHGRELVLNEIKFFNPLVANSFAPGFHHPQRKFKMQKSTLKGYTVAVRYLAHFAAQ